MRISQATIDKVRDTNIINIISPYVDLKKKGQHHEGCCPFHDEKTGSFKVNEARQFYKCFGCGASGDGIKFITEKQGLDFYGAIRYIADSQGIPVEEEKDTLKESQELKDSREQYRKINKAAARQYQKKLLELLQTEPPFEDLAHELLDRRNYSLETVIDFQIGFAPDEWRFLTEPIVSRGLFVPAQELGLLNNKNEKNFDTFRNRVMFPILDPNGGVLGFGGRYLQKKKLGPGEKSIPDETPKYLNSPDSKIYNKSKILYGLYQAQTKIRKKGFAYLVEGYTDVVSFYQGGLENTVGSCGTSLTEDQARLLKKYCSHVIIIYDGDSAGQKATSRAIDILVKEGFKVQVVELEATQDPDSFIRDYAEAVGDMELHFKREATDGILWKAGKLFNPETESDPDLKTRACDDLCKLLSIIPNAIKKDEYLKIIVKKHKLKEKLILKQIQECGEQTVKKKGKNKAEGDTGHFYPFQYPEGVDPQEAYENGFYPLVDGDNTGYWFRDSSDENKFTKRSNFIINPLYHKDSVRDNTRIIEIINSKQTRIVELDSKAMISADQFRAFMFQKGGFLWRGNNEHLYKIVETMVHSFPYCHELSTLGFQPEGFFAFSNYVFNGQLQKYDDNGIVTIHDQHFLSPAVSKTQQHLRLENDEYQNDRYLSLNPEPPISFKEWAALMNAVYERNSWMGILFCCVTIFRDIVLKTTKCPILYAYGPVGSGKSEFGESLNNLFFSGKSSDGKLLQAFNLNQGTEFAFFNRMARFRNCLNLLNEFDEEKINPKFFGAIKGAWDGEGRERGAGGSKNRSEIQPINCTVLIMGQFLTTKDDASVLTRSIPLKFSQNNNRTNEQVKNHKKLKEYEQQGISGIILELLKLRTHVLENFSQAYWKAEKKLGDEIRTDSKEARTRILKNYAAMVSMYDVLKDKIDFPFTGEEFYQLAKSNIIDLGELVADSNSLGSFWKAVENLTDRNEVENGWDYRIELLNSVKVKNSHGDTEEKIFDKTKKVLFLRLTSIYQKYKELYRNEAVNDKTIEVYLKEQKYYIGHSNAVRFTKSDGEYKVTSCFILDYGSLGVDIERSRENESSTVTKGIAIKGSIIYKDAEIVNTSGTDTLEFQFYNEEITMKDDRQVKKVFKANCFSTEEYHMSMVSKLMKGSNIKITGQLTERNYKDKVSQEDRVYRRIKIDSIEHVKSEMEIKFEPASQEEDLPF